MSNPREFTLNQEMITPDDLEKVLNDLKAGDECVLTFTKVKEGVQDFPSLRPILSKILSLASRVVIIAPADFEMIRVGMKTDKLHFINKPGFSYLGVEGFDFDTVFVSLIESFWAYYYPGIKKVTGGLVADYTAQAEVTLIRTNQNFWMVLKMNEASLKDVAEKILYFNMDGEEAYPPGDIVIEILNMICGLLKPLIRLRNLTYQIEIGIPQEIQKEAPPGVGDPVYHWTFEIAPGAFFEILLNQEVKNVST